MRVKFELKLHDTVVENKRINCIIFDWESELEEQEVLELTHKFITSRKFFTSRMSGLDYVRESELSIEPVEENANLMDKLELLQKYCSPPLT